MAQNFNSNNHLYNIGSQSHYGSYNNEGIPYNFSGKQNVAPLISPQALSNGGMMMGPQNGKLMPPTAPTSINPNMYINSPNILSDPSINYLDYNNFNLDLNNNLPSMVNQTINQNMLPASYYKQYNPNIPNKNSQIRQMRTDGSNISSHINISLQTCTANVLRLTFPLRKGILLEPFRLEHNTNSARHAFDLRNIIYEELMWREDLEIQLKCFHHEDKFMRVNWPKNIQILINDHNIEIEKSNDMWQQKAIFLKNSCNSGINALSISVDQCACSHLFVLQLVHRPTILNIMTRIMSKQRLDQSSSIAKFKNFFQNKSQNLRNIPGSDSNTVQACKIMRKCPISGCPIILPVRGSHCNHLQCFDLESYLFLNLERALWRCPMCFSATVVESLYVDDFMLNVLHNAKSFNCNSINVFPDGKWNPILIEEKLGDMDSNTEKSYFQSPRLNQNDPNINQSISTGSVNSGNNILSPNPMPSSNGNFGQPLYPEMSNSKIFDSKNSSFINPLGSGTLMEQHASMPDIGDNLKPINSDIMNFQGKEIENTKNNVDNQNAANSQNRNYHKMEQTYDEALSYENLDRILNEGSMTLDYNNFNPSSVYQNSMNNGHSSLANSKNNSSEHQKINGAVQNNYQPQLMQQRFSTSQHNPSIISTEIPQQSKIGISEHNTLARQQVGENFYMDQLHHQSDNYAYCNGTSDVDLKLAGIGLDDDHFENTFGV
ncbi:MAG: Zinc finger MIZ domain-containing protein 1 [Paramarteilia canceri]